MLVLAFSQWEGRRLNREQKGVVFPSEFSHIAAVMAVSAKKPLLVLLEKTVAGRGAFRRSFVHPVIDLPAAMSLAWLDLAEFQKPLTRGPSKSMSSNTYSWDILRSQKIPQISYTNFYRKSSGSGSLTGGIFRPATRFGILSSGPSVFQAVAFFFLWPMTRWGARELLNWRPGTISSMKPDTLRPKGRPQSLIVRQEGTKIPSDLGGILYLGLANPADIGPIETRLREHIERMLK